LAAFAFALALAFGLAANAPAAEIAIANNTYANFLIALCILFM
jgi:hypothetical protein